MLLGTWRSRAVTSRNSMSLGSTSNVDSSSSMHSNFYEYSLIQGFWVCGVTSDTDLLTTCPVPDPWVKCPGPYFKGHTCH